MTALLIINFASDRIKTVGGVRTVLKWPTPYGPVLTRISKCHKNFKIFGRLLNIYHSLYSLITNILTMKFGWNQMKIGRVVEFENRNIGNFAKCTKWPQTKLKELGIKSTPPMCTIVPRDPNFRPFLSTISRFQNIAYFTIFPLTPMLKCQSATKF